MNEKQIFPYRIPDSFFLPHTVKSPFYAKVIYRVHDGEPVIEEVGLSPKCLLYIKDTFGMMTQIEKELKEKLRKDSMVSNIHETIAGAIRTHI